MTGSRGDQKARTSQAEKAAATRRRIGAAALELFVERGYAATSIDSIAKRAGVAVQTVYYFYGNKIAILKGLLDVSVAGDDAPIPTLDRPWVAEAVAADPTEQLRIQVSAARQISERAAAVLQTLRGAATADAEAAELWAANRAQLRTVQQHLVTALADKNALRDELDIETATDIAYAIIGADVYQILVHERGWSPMQWEQWTVQLLQQQLLPAGFGGPVQHHL